MRFVAAELGFAGRIVAGLLASAWVALSAPATVRAHRTCGRIPLHERIEQALWIIEARVVHTERASTTEFGTYLKTTFEVERVWKGDPPRGEVVLGYVQVPGQRRVPGISPGRTMLIFVGGSESAPTYSLGCGLAEYIEQSDVAELERRQPHRSGCGSCGVAAGGRRDGSGVVALVALLFAWRRRSRTEARAGSR